MNADTSEGSTERTPFTGRAYVRRVLDHFSAEWRDTVVLMRFYIAGTGLIVLAMVMIRFKAPSPWISGQLLIGAVLASAGFMLEVYKVIDGLWETKLGKLAGILLGTMVAAMAMALAQLIVNDATGIDPSHFPLTAAFIAPLTAGYVLAVLALLAVIGGFVWFIAGTFVDAVKTGWAFGWGRKYSPENPMLGGMRFVAVVVMSVLLAVVAGAGQRPYAGFLSGTAGWFAYSFEMYGSDPCSVPNTRIRRLTDEVVAIGHSTPAGPSFYTLACPISASAGPAPAR